MMSEPGTARYKPRRKATRASRSSRSGSRSTAPAEGTPPAPPEPPSYSPRPSDESPGWAGAQNAGASNESPFWAASTQSRPATPQYAPRGALPSYTAPTYTAPPGDSTSGPISRPRPAGGSPSWVDQPIAGTDPDPPASARRAARRKPVDPDPSRTTGDADVRRTASSDADLRRTASADADLRRTTRGDVDLRRTTSGDDTWRPPGETAAGRSASDATLWRPAGETEPSRARTSLGETAGAWSSRYADTPDSPTTEPNGDAAAAWS